MHKMFARICVAAALGTIVAAPAFGADADVTQHRRDAGALWRGNMQLHSLPFARSERAAAIWDERACWSECGAHTAWGMTTCLQYDVQGRCLRLADKADRFCQRACRTMGGPLVSGIFAD